MRRLPVASLSLLVWLAPATRAGADLAEMQKRGTLRILVVLSEDEPQFFSVKPGLPPGFDQEILEGFAKLHKLRLEVAPCPGWDALIPHLVKGKGDVIAGGFTDTEARRRQIEFSPEVFPTRTVVATRKPHRVIRTVEELREEKVGAIRGTTMIDALAAAGVSSVDDSLVAGAFPEALKSKKITAAVDGVEAVLKAKIADPELQIGMFLGPPESLAYGIRKEDRALLKALHEYVANLRRTPTWSRLVVKYFGKAGPEILKKARGE